ncbi:helix-turn-helix domain containing protein [Aliarcobacter butzleri]|uniref:helix-turn-helix domain containing protein n=1 Tax=Aliarcobacter butzleri TaxID=28197 RepID=UPI0021B2447D|nr:helix-turn-helix domain containing protein [Aliarcobacter butzleri]MCT7549060.1 helix-turn-helix domain containing protein [Aliarcobacter butzleri]MCT7558370.1 helix-turn-helix domain containing protein [Aliarcobacter butzleri]MCT7610593.1 helix-turn-helix domain containing protein [Aliarcobacter butzleri]
MDFEYYFDKIFNFYNVSSIKELSEAINTGASTISNWKQRNSITALKRKCRELGIYNEIFGNLNTDIQSINTISGGQNAQSVHGNQIQDLNNKFSDIDDATIGLFIEAYKKAKETNDIKGLRLHLMEYSDE